jgi:hypothetical protein
MFFFVDKGEWMQTLRYPHRQKIFEEFKLNAEANYYRRAA